MTSRRTWIIRTMAGAATAGGLHAAARTEIAIEGDRFLVNGKPTYAGRTFRGMKIEGLLMNSRMVQGIFDDANPATRGRWAYPDTSRWDPERNVQEFLAAMPEWRRHGLLSFTINMQGGSPQGYSKEQPWINNGYDENGNPRKDYLARLDRILKKADELGMAPIVGCYYFGQDERLKDEAAVKRGVESMADWLLRRGYRNVLLEVNNECNVRYDHEILRPGRVHELIGMARQITYRGRRLYVSTSYGGNTVVKENVARAADFILLHGNGVKDPKRIYEMVQQARAVPGYRPMPVLFNEDDHFDFDKPSNNMIEAVRAYASWGYFDPGASDYVDGYQCPPVNWSINTERKKSFFGLLKEMTGA